MSCHVLYLSFCCTAHNSHQFVAQHACPAINQSIVRSCQSKDRTDLHGASASKTRVCKAIWGDGCYNLDFDTEDDDHYGYIRKELEDSYGPTLLDSGRCGSIDEACNELERMLANECKAWEGK